MKATVIFLMGCLLFLSCSPDSSDNNNPTSVEAKFVLPYPVGEAYTCSQGFNSTFSHNGTFKYAVDFDMPIGTLVTAARDGRVVYVVQDYSDNDHTVGHENVVIVMHDDSTYARYVHLTTNGALVAENQLLAPGDTVGLSGNSGNSNHPHLHFDVTGTFAGRSDQTIPFDFKNTSPHPIGFEKGIVYEAFPY
jgi:murein DD-endopeptidase MepM/ murein hydrolase activator NlpD